MTSATPRVALRGDGGPRVGGGHLARLGAVAMALAERRVASELVGRTEPPANGDLTAFHALRIAPEPGDPEQELPDDRQVLDAAETLTALGPAELEAVLVDHYRLGAAWEDAVRSAGVARIAAIDDLPGRSHTADLLIDPNLGNEEGPMLLGRGRTLRGTAYVPLAREYRQGRSPEGPRGRARLLVTLGGGRGGIAPRLAGAIRAEHRLADVALDVVVPDVAERDRVRQALDGRAHATVHGRVPTLAPLLAQADLVIGAGGSTNWERLRYGVPGVVVALAPNQRRTCRALVDLGLARWVDPAEDVGLVAATAADALSDTGLLDHVRAAGPLLVDGRGAERVALALFPPSASPRLRPATPDDAAAVLAMSNDPDARRGSRDSGTIEPLAHLRWFTERLGDPSTLFLVADSVGGLPVGQVRFRRTSPGAWELSYGLEAAARGNRWAGTILTDGVASLRQHEPDATVVAVVREENMTSRRAFERLGFVADPSGTGAEACGAEVGRGFTAYLLPQDTSLR